MGSRDWSNLKVSAATQRFIKEQGFARMTPVQAIAIPLLLNHRDVAVEACTGSGKTLAFLIPVVEILLGCGASALGAFNVGCVILSPTRELAMQINEVFGSFLAAVAREDSSLGARIAGMLMVGGTEAKAAADAIRRADAMGQLQVVVATPGRLRAILDLAGKDALNLKPLEVLVLDEADRLLQLGFETDVNAILSALPKQRRTGLFSATLTSELQRLMKTGMRNPVHVCVRLKRPAGGADNQDVQKQQLSIANVGGGDSKDVSQGESKAEVTTRHELPTKLQNYVVTLPTPHKLAFLKDFLASPEVRQGKTIVFFLTCACVDLFYALLRELLPGQQSAQPKKRKRQQAKKSLKGGRIEKLHGQMDQTARTKAYEQFCKAPPSEGSVLLCTDLAARGIDVEAISWVVQFDAPLDPSAFVHRIGRAARAGQSGKSLLMLMTHEDGYLPFLRQRGIPLEDLPASAAPSAWRESGSDAKAISMPSDASMEAAIRPAKRLVETDRTTMLRSSKAFVSFLRAYQEHQLQYLFPFKGLDIGSVATGYCLLRIPRMKEILGKKIKGFVQSSIDPLSVPLRDKAQERQRQERLKKKWEEDENAWIAENTAWEKTRAKRDEKEAKAKQEKERTRTEKRQAKRINKAEEWRLLQAEECLAKKMRKGRITAKEFLRKVQKSTREKDGADSGASDSDSDLSDDEGGARKRRRTGGDADTVGDDCTWLKKRKRRRAKGGKC